MRGTGLAGWLPLVLFCASAFLAYGASSAPTPLSAGAGAPAVGASGNSSVCFDPAFHNPGTRWVEHRTTTMDGKFYQSVEIDHEVLGPATFNGNSAVAVRQVVRFTAGAGAGLWADHRFYARYDGVEYRTFGNEGTSRTSTGKDITSRTSYEPSALLMVALAPGQSFSHSYTNTYVQIAPLPAPPAQVFKVSVTNTFVRFETITVPAGTFVDACKFRKVTTLDNGSPSETTTWLARGGELQLKTVTRRLVTVMDSATRNGAPITR